MQGIRTIMGEEKFYFLKGMEYYCGEKICLVVLKNNNFSAEGIMLKYPVASLYVGNEQNNKIQVNGKYHSIKNQVAIIPKEIPHGIELPSQWTMILCMNQDMVESYLSRFMQNPTDEPITFDLPESFKIYAREFVKELQQKKSNHAEVLRSIEKLMCLSLSGAMQKACSKKKMAFEVSQSIQFMRENLDRSLSIRDICKIAEKRPGQLNTAFRKAVGESPMVHMENLRFERACDLIKNSNLPMEKIAKSCGFLSESHFSMGFSKKYYVSPKEYRIMHVNQLTQGSLYEF